MVKNVKIDDETHRLLSMAAAELTYKKSDLCSILVRAALTKLTPAELEEVARKYAEEKPDS